jgi:hypothetical protein
MPTHGGVFLAGLEENQGYVFADLTPAGENGSND